MHYCSVFRHVLICFTLESIWTSGKLPFDCQKIAKNCHFSKKNAIGNFLAKRQFLAIFWKKYQILGYFFTLKWQFSGGSALKSMWDSWGRKPCEKNVSTGRCQWLPLEIAPPTVLISWLETAAAEQRGFSFVRHPQVRHLT